MNIFRRKLERLLLKPIPVFCLHHVSVELDVLSMNVCDWMLIEEFKSRVLQMRQDGVDLI